MGIESLERFVEADIEVLELLSIHGFAPLLEGVFMPCLCHNRHRRLARARLKGCVAPEACPFGRAQGYGILGNENPGEELNRFNSGDP